MADDDMRPPAVGSWAAVVLTDGIFSGAALLAGILSEQFNANLDALLGSLEVGLPGIEIARLDVFKILNEVVADPGAFGLSVVDTACVTPNIPPFTCRDPDEYLFWDGIHPTKVAHGLLAHETAMALGP